jgi:anti-sigma B factor antagonist
MPAGSHSFSYEIEKSGDEATGKVTTVICHGQLVNQTADQLKEVVKPLIAGGGRIILDFGDISYVDSMGLGSLVGLKVSAIAAGYCTLEFEHLSQRVQELLRLTNLTLLFKS